MNTIGGITEMLILRNSFVIVTTPRNTERKKHQKEKKKKHQAEKCMVKIKIGI